MKHYFIFKYGRVFFEKVYEMYSDKDTALNFLESLQKQYNCSLLLCEVQ